MSDNGKIGEFETSFAFTDFFIKRPIFAWVVNVMLIIMGLVALTQLSIRQYPRIENPVITITTGWSGASVSAIESQVTRPLEDIFSSLEGLDHITSDSDPEQSKIKLYFTNRSADAALSEIIERLNKNSRVLPEETDKPTITKADADANPIMKIALTGEGFSTAELYDMADRSIKNSFETVAGVATVDIAGGSGFQMNLTLDPVKMEAYKITAIEVLDALKRYNLQQKPAGKLTAKEQEFILTTRSCLNNPQAFNDMIISERKSGVVKVSDIGSASVCPEEEKYMVTFNGKPGVVFNIIPQPQSNPIEISKEIRKRVSDIQSGLPSGVELSVAIDRTIFIEKSINQVYRAIWEAIALVLVVILVFLCSARASIIPMITIPISLVATLFVMFLMGFTINILSLLALVLAIGLVVDDAIVVMENVYRHIERGLSPMDAAIVGCREIRFSVIAMTLTLAAVYAPIAYAPGLMARVFREFALTLAASVIISGFAALTLSPAMCARLLKSHAGEGAVSEEFAGYGWVSYFLKYLDVAAEKTRAFLARVDLVYTRYVNSALDNSSTVLSVAGVFFCISIFLAMFHIKKEFSPAEDQGIVQGVFSSAPATNLKYLTKYNAKIDEIFAAEPEVGNRVIISQTNDESYIVSTLSPWENRSRKCRDILPNLRTKLWDLVGISSRVGCPSYSMKGGGAEKPLSFLLLTNKSYQELEKVGLDIMEKIIAKQDGVDRHTLDPARLATVPEYIIIPKNMEYAHELGIDPDTIARTLQILIRGSNATKFEKENKMYPVHIWIGEQFRKSPSDILQLSVKGYKKRNEEVMIPLKNIIDIEQKESQPSIAHYEKKRSFPIRAGLIYGYGIGSVYADVKQKIEAELPAGYSIEPIDDLKTFLNENRNIYVIFGLSLVFIFLVLAAQFESLVAPFIILMSVPLAVGGAMMTLSLMPTGSLNIYSQIGLITLIGLIAKHGILLTDFANRAQEERGVSRRDAILEACHLRLRPILMTTFAMMLGALPLALASGAGSESRRQIGAVIVGGMGIGTLFTLFVVPVVYMLFRGRKGQKAVNSANGN
ncbi:efflux RND transporter permease subunit [Candidatus Hydrogenosomobacter endosymbioticus]|uniref:Acriflavin resistance protein n=1 Tax=Candidatus Hydrogenosomobacter endosymbioticus TaxID=2558174 RepID=A0ABN6L7W2_9PROT|nr:efflux RND transporter permease subunit [Candidatus Hydrogenosomobacter endosymbioticus]BDB96257.1 acriflavin resistance protein [Candidatus Hydrogenosomobacter endosymbioticus]